MYHTILTNSYNGPQFSLQEMLVGFKKVNLEDEKVGNQSLISIAYSSRIVFNYIKAEQEELSSNVELDQGPAILSLSVYEV